MLARLAGRAPVPVFVAVGLGGRSVARRLRLDERIEVVDTPRHAIVLLVAGGITPAMVDPLRRVHDQLPPPRATIIWTAGRPPEPDPLAAAAIGEASIVADASPSVAVDEIVRVGRMIRAGGLDEPDLMADRDPAEWRGVGPYQQGGKGMTGGVPYGRPMAGRAPDRDTLELDQLQWRLGPFLPMLPPGLILDVKIQGDVVQEMVVADNPFATDAPDRPDAPDPADLTDLADLTDEGIGLFVRALSGGVRVAELELARATHHLAWVSEALRVAGLPALGYRALMLAEQIRAGNFDAAGPSVDRLMGRVGRDLGLRWSNRGVGLLGAPQIEAARVTGPVARASGVAQDARAGDPMYGSLGFEPIMQTGGDVAARWLQRLREARQSLDLAARSGDQVWPGGETVESPTGRLSIGDSAPTARLLELVPSLTEGLEWGEAMAAIISLDLDMEHAALGAVAPVVTRS